MRTYVAVIALIFIAVAATAAKSDDAGPKTAYYPDDIVYTGTGMAVVFSHEMHVDGLGFSCDSCHDGTFEVRTNAAKEKGDFKMAVIQDGEYCGKCHDGNTAFSSGDFASCGTCHAGAAGAKEVPGLKVIGPDEAIKLGAEGMEAEFRHPAHASFPCYKCHTDLFPMKSTGTITTMDEINAGKKCGLCHNGSVAFDATNCAVCHPNM